MSDADLIYNACLRAERRLEALGTSVEKQPASSLGALAALIAIRTLREEIGNGLAEERR